MCFMPFSYEDVVVGLLLTVLQVCELADPLQFVHLYVCTSMYALSRFTAICALVSIKTPYYCRPIAILRTCTHIHT